jgi:hypothetical protein
MDLNTIRILTSYSIYLMASNSHAWKKIHAVNQEDIFGLEVTGLPLADGEGSGEVVVRGEIFGWCVSFGEDWLRMDMVWG